MSLERALELAERGRGTTHPNPIVGCVIVRGNKIVGEAWHEVVGGPHAEALALQQAGERARGATAYVTMEPCTHHGRTPPCADALIEAGVTAVLAGCLDPHPEHGGGLERLRAAGVQVTVAGDELGFECRAQNEEWRTWVSLGRPFELRARVGAVAVGMGTVRADDPELSARDVEVKRQPRRLAFGHGPLPRRSELELRSGALADELQALAGEGVESLLLEGGPTIAAAFLRENLVDKVFVFVAPKLAGSGPAFVPELASPLELTRLRAQPLGEDVLLTAYVHEP